MRPMVAGTALAGLLASIALMLQHAAPPTQRLRRVAQGLAGATLALGTLFLVAYLAAIGSTNIDASPNSLADVLVLPSSQTSINMMLVGLALLTLDWETKRGHRPAQWFAALGAMNALVGLVSSLYNVAIVSTSTSGTDTSLFTVLVFLLLNLGLLAARPTSGIMALLTETSAGGVMLRRLLPAALVAPLLIGGLLLVGQLAGWHSLLVTIALAVVLHMFVFALLVWWNAGTLRRVEAARLVAEAERVQLAERECAARMQAEQAEQAASRIARIQAVTAALGEALLPTEVAEILVRQGAAASGASGGVVALLSSDESRLELMYTQGYAPDVTMAWQYIPLDASTPLAEVVRTGQPLLIESPQEARTRFPQLAEASQDFGAWASLPLLTNGTAIGAFDLSFAAPRQFSAEDRALLETLAQLAAQALQRARLYEGERSAHQAAAAAVRLRDQFLSIASHELKTPITALMGNVELLQRRTARLPGLEARELRYIDVVAGQAERLLRMVNALLDVSRIQEGQLRLERKPFDLHLLIEQLVLEVQPTLVEHMLHYQPPAAPLEVLGDALRLEQVVQNLIHNAVKYSPNGGLISISASQSKQEVRISVRDSGIGIPAADLPYIFRRFHRAANAAERYMSGLGIGLFVVQEIVGMHGGYVTVESEEGQGSTFTVVLPSLAATRHPTADALVLERILQ
jgi:signal transduction histidine kinase